MNKKIIIFIIFTMNVLLICSADYAVVYGSGAAASDGTVATNIDVGLAGSVTGGVTEITEENEERAKTWSKQEICRFMKGCLEGDNCYPWGYTKNNQYCGIYLISQSFERTKFLNQSDAGENCTYDFQCKSNFCFNGSCIGKIESLLVSVMNKISALELKIEKTETFSNSEQIQNESLPIKTGIEKRETFGIKLLEFFKII